MRLSGKLPGIILLTVLLGGAVILAARWYDTDTSIDSDGAQASVVVPTLSQTALMGKTLFDANCARCHGNNAAGGNSGPPLVHKIYEPNHHADMAFVLAAKRGVRAHHWPFGNMPALPDLAESDLTRIVVYVRELQKANGIF
ncbi:MAG: cytochrome c [Fimbriimonadaceae bacterium]|nr:cytochrome c [Alphaproteobacteria bacterium]